MHYFLCLNIEQFYVRNLPTERLETNPERPRVIFAKKTVLDANTVARHKKVLPGTPLSQAKALLDNGEYHEWKADDYRAAQKQWLDILPLYSSVIEPGNEIDQEQHVAFVDLSAHPNPENIVPRLLDSLGQPARWGAAQTQWLARLAMRFDAYDVAVKHPLSLLNLMPVQELSPILPEHRERLAFLGYPTVGAVAQIPSKVLASQFGKEGIRIAAAARGELFEPVKARYPDKTLSFTFRFESAVLDSLAFEDAFRTLATQAGAELSSLESHSHSFRLIVEAESQIFVLSKQVQKPIHGVLACRVALGSLNLKVIDEPVVCFRLLIENLEKRKRVQRELNYQALGDADIDKSSKIRLIQQTVTSVQKSHGIDSLKLASQVLIPRELQAIRQWEKALGTRRI